MLTSAQRRPQWFFYPAWVATSVISIPIGWWIGWAIMALVVKTVGGTIMVGGQRHITEDFLFGYILIPMLGLVTGLLQYLLLQHYLPRMKWWIGATLFGWLLFTGVLFGWVFFGSFPSGLPPVVAGVLLGGAIGLCQWLTLRQRVRRATLWILISTLGWALAFLFTDGAISNQQEVLSIIFLPPIVTSMGWWLLLDILPQRESVVNAI